MEAQKTIMLILDFLIILIVTLGFILLRKYIKAHSKENVETIEKPVSKIIIIVGISIAVISFIVMSIGVFSQPF